MSDYIDEFKPYADGFADGFKQGRADALRPIPIEEYDWSATDESIILAFDKYGQAFMPSGMVKIKDTVYNAKGYNFNTQEFLRGKEVDQGFGRKIRILPREIKWFLKLPTAEQIKEQTNDTEGTDQH